MEQGMEQTSVIAGTSGATIELTSVGAVKYAADPALWQRLGSQANYMAKHGAPFAAITGVAIGRYWMERLYPLHIKGAAIRSLLLQARTALLPLWSKLVEPPAMWKHKHIDYVKGLCSLHKLPQLLEMLVYDWNNISELSLTACVTHGDATLDNLLIDAHGLHRWVDPLPPSDSIPPLLAVDLGKLLQSADGYERRKYGAEWPSAGGHDAVLSGLSKANVLAAKYFRAVSYLRMLRYVQGDNLDYARGELKCYTCLT